MQLDSHLFPCSFQISRNLGKMYSEMIFINGFVHCDPHPGNVLVRKRPDTGKAEVVLLDHGLYQVGEASPTQPAPGSSPAWGHSPLNSPVGHSNRRQMAKVSGEAVPSPSNCHSV